jgi:hypothetical protein
MTSTLSGATVLTAGIEAPAARRGRAHPVARTLRDIADAAARAAAYVRAMTLVWFVVWLVATLIGDDEALTFDPVNVWAGALLLCVALDLGRQHAPSSR